MSGSSDEDSVKVGRLRGAPYWLAWTRAVVETIVEGGTTPTGTTPTRAFKAQQRGKVRLRREALLRGSGSSHGGSLRRTSQEKESAS